MERKARVKSLPRKNKVDDFQVYCRKCTKTKPSKEFFIATDLYLDSNGFFSVCKECCTEIYKLMFQSEGNVARAILRCCRMFNVIFDETAVMATESHLKTVEGSNDKAFGIYKTKLSSISKRGFKDKIISTDLTFSEPTKMLPPSDPLKETDKNAEELIQFWGESLNHDDYAWLEVEYAKWSRDYSIKNSGEINLLKLIILKLFAIRQAMKEQKPVNKLEEEFQNLLKTSALSPAQTNAATQGKLGDSYGMLIKMIEEETPAEHYQNYKLFDDFFDLKKYLRDFVSRPITNFFNGRKNYIVSDDEDVVLDNAAFESNDVPELKTEIKNDLESE
jgi:hypothetical protein